MKILVVGTSNSLVRGGWYDGLQNVLAGAHDVQRIALGGAPFSQFLSLLGEIERQAPDHVIVECSANDESYPTHVGSDVFVDRLYYMFLSTLRSFAGVTVLRIPPQATIETGSALARRQAGICRQLGCAFHDTTAELLELGKETGSPFRDKHHPQTEIAHRIGQSFAEQLKARLPGTKPDVEMQNFAACVTEIAPQCLDCQVARIETTLVAEDFAILTPGTVIRLPRTEFILGFFVNSGETRGVLRLDGAVQTRDLFCYFMEPANRNVKRYIPVANGLHVRRLTSLFAHQAVDLALHTDLFHFPQQISLGKLVTLNMDQPG